MNKVWKADMVKECLRKRELDFIFIFKLTSFFIQLEIKPHIHEN